MLEMVPCILGTMKSKKVFAIVVTITRLEIHHIRVVPYTTVPTYYFLSFFGTKNMKCYLAFLFFLNI